MMLKLYKFKLQTEKKLINFWYWIMKPVAYFLTDEKERKRYQRKESRITEEKAIKYIAKDLAKQVIKYKSDKFLICSYADEDDFWNDCKLNYFSVQIKKARMSFRKFGESIEFQEKIFDYLKAFNGIKVTEKVEQFPSYKHIKDYKKTVFIESI